jgi:PrcB C-terminal
MTSLFPNTTRVLSALQSSGLGGLLSGSSPASAPNVSSLLGLGSSVDLTQDNRYGAQRRYGLPVQRPHANPFGGLGQILQLLLLVQLLQKLFAPAPTTPVTPTPSPAVPVAFNQVIGGNETPVMRAQPRSEVINTQAEFDRAFLRLSGDYLDPNAFNPATESAAYLGLGSRNTGGYSVNVQSVSEENGKLVVRWSEGTPAPGQAVTQAFTAPAKLIKFANPNKLPVEIIKTS